MRGVGKQAALLLLPALVLSLTGCRSNALPYGREIEHMALMRVIGVDKAEEGVAVTVSSGTQSKGAQQGDAPPVVLTQTSGTISGALLSMQADGASYVFYGHVGQLLLGEALAREDVIPALEYVLRDIEMRLDTGLYLVKGSAEQAISAPAEGEGSDGEGPSSAADRLEAMESDAKLRSYATPRTVGEVLGELDDQGASYAPALILAQGEQDQLEAAGYGVLRDGALAAWTTDEQAHGVNLVEGQVNADIVEVELPGSRRAALRVVGAKTKVAPVFQDGALTGLTVTCRVEANLAEGSADLGLGQGDALAALEDALADRESARIRSALDLAQQLDADYLGLVRRAGMSAPWRWADIQADWDLPGLVLEVEVLAHIERGYNIDR